MILMSEAYEDHLEQLAELSSDKDRRVYLKQHSIDRALIPEMLTQTTLREKAKERLGELAETLLFDRELLEQMTDPLVGAFKASLVQGGDHVFVGCTGLGGELMWLGASGNPASITGVDIDPAATLLSKYNYLSSHASPTLSMVLGDVEEIIHQTEERYDWAFMDPMRRTSGKRHVRLEDYEPNPKDLLPRLQSISKKVFIKVAPAIDWKGLARELKIPTIYVIEARGQLKEIGLCFDAPYEGDTRVVAVSCSESGAITEESTLETLMTTAPSFSSLEVGMYLHQPSPALVRSSLFLSVALRDGLAMIDSDSSLLVSKTPTLPTWFRSFQITAILPYKPKEIRAYCKKHQISSLTVKKRYFPLTPDKILKQLKMKEGGQLSYATTVGGKRLLILVEEVTRV